MTNRRPIAHPFFNRPAVWIGWGVLLLLFETLPAVSRSQERVTETKSAAPVDAQLLLIGSLASSHVYTTYGYIGVVADNAQKDIYTPQRVEDLMNEVTVISDSLTAQLDTLLKSGLTPEDEKAVKEIVEIYGLLKQESVALRKYAKEKTETNGTEFRRLRDEAWIRVAKLLDIPGETPAVK